MIDEKKLLTSTIVLGKVVQKKMKEEMGETIHFYEAFNIGLQLTMVATLGNINITDQVIKDFIQEEQKKKKQNERRSRRK
jgi:hypothetical protein